MKAPRNSYTFASLDSLVEPPATPPRNTLSARLFLAIRIPRAYQKKGSETRFLMNALANSFTFHSATPRPEGARENEI